MFERSDIINPNKLRNSMDLLCDARPLRCHVPQRREHDAPKMRTAQPSTEHRLQPACRRRKKGKVYNATQLPAVHLSWKETEVCGDSPRGSRRRPASRKAEVVQVPPTTHTPRLPRLPRPTPHASHASHAPTPLSPTPPTPPPSLPRTPPTPPRPPPPPPPPSPPPPPPSAPPPPPPPSAPSAPLRPPPPPSAPSRPPPPVPHTDEPHARARDGPRCRRDARRAT